MNRRNFVVFLGTLPFCKNLFAHSHEYVLLTITEPRIKITCNIFDKVYPAVKLFGLTNKPIYVPLLFDKIPTDCVDNIHRNLDERFPKKVVIVKSGNKYGIVGLSRKDHNWSSFNELLVPAFFDEVC